MLAAARSSSNVASLAIHGPNGISFSNAAPERDWDMAGMAALGHVTERHLLRLFSRHAGVSPLQFLEAIRLERARQSLEHGASVTSAAEAAGFRSGLRLRRAWNRKWGGSPRDASIAAPQSSLARASLRQG